MNEVFNEAPNFFDQFRPHYERLAEKIWQKDKVRFDRDVYSISRDILQRAFSAGFGSITTDLNSPDHLRVSLQEANIARFAAAKTAAQVFELNRLLNSHKDFQSFSQAAQKLGITYNNSYLKAEYDTAISTAQTSRDYYNQLDNKNTFPYAEFDTSGDGRVRDEHAKLDGIVVKVGSREHDLLNPPLGYNCRCRLRPLLANEVSEKDLKSKEQIINVMKSTKVGKKNTFEIMEKYGFDKNKAKVNEVFSSAQSYIKNFKESGVTFKDYQLNSYKNLRNNLTSYQATNVDKASWFNERIGMNSLNNSKAIRLKDFRDRPIVWTAKSYRFADPVAVQNTLSFPDEVWLVKDGKTYQRNYIRMWNNQAIRVQVNLSNDLEEQIVNARFENNIDSFRKGILVK